MQTLLSRKKKTTRKLIAGDISSGYFIVMIELLFSPLEITRVYS